MTEPIIIILMAAGVAAAGVSAYYAVRSAKDQKRSADVSEKDSVLRGTPILGFEVPSWRISSEGINVHFKFLNAGEFPIELKQVIFTWWFKSQSQIQHSIEKNLRRLLQKQESFEPDPRLRFGEYEFRKHEIDETKSLQGADFYKRISGMFRVEYSGVDGTLRHEERPVESLA